MAEQPPVQSVQVPAIVVHAPIVDEQESITDGRRPFVNVVLPVRDTPRRVAVKKKPGINFNKLFHLADHLHFQNKGKVFLRLFAHVANMKDLKDISKWASFLVDGYVGSPDIEAVWHDSAVVIRLASHLPHWHLAQQVLLQFLLILSNRFPEWKDLKEFETELDRQWRWTPVLYDYTAIPADAKFTFDEWLNLNAFIAKIYNVTTSGFGSFAASALRLGLESWTPDDAALAEVHVNVACAWLQLGGRRLYLECCKNSHSVKPADGNPFGNGILFNATTTGFTVARWNFWKDMASTIPDITIFEPSADMHQAEYDGAIDTIGFTPLT